MAIVNKIPERVPIPHEPGEWIELVRLDYGDLKRAKSEKDLADFLRSQDLMSRQDAEKAVAVRKLTKSIREELGDDGIRKVIGGDFWDQHDEQTIFEIVVHAWSYTDGKPNPEDLTTLDPVTTDWLKQTILDMNTLGSQEDVENLESDSRTSTTKSGEDSGQNS